MVGVGGGGVGQPLPPPGRAESTGKADSTTGGGGGINSNGSLSDRKVSKIQSGRKYFYISSWQEMMLAMVSNDPPLMTQASLLFPLQNHLDAPTSIDVSTMISTLHSFVSIKSNGRSTV